MDECDIDHPEPGEGDVVVRAERGGPRGAGVEEFGWSQGGRPGAGAQEFGTTESGATVGVTEVVPADV